MPVLHEVAPVPPQVDRVIVREGQTDEAHRQLADHLTDHLGKASFPSAEIAPGEYLADSDVLVEHFAKKADVNSAVLPTYQAYVGHIMPRLRQLFQENIELKRRFDATAGDAGVSGVPGVTAPKS